MGHFWTRPPIYICPIVGHFWTRPPINLSWTIFGRLPIYLSWAIFGHVHQPIVGHFWTRPPITISPLDIPAPADLCSVPPLFPADSDDVAESGRVVGSIPHRWPMEPSYFHSFGITPNYFVFVQQPLVIRVKKLLTLKLKKRPVTEAIADKPEQGVSWRNSCHVMQRTRRWTWMVIGLTTGCFIMVGSFEIICRVPHDLLFSSWFGRNDVLKKNPLCSSTSLCGGLSISAKSPVTL